MIKLKTKKANYGTSMNSRVVKGVALKLQCVMLRGFESRFMQ